MAIAQDLKALLTGADEPSPYVLAGHSFGALYVRAFAARYPEQTAGVVLLDATDPHAFEGLPAYPTFFYVYRRASALFPSLARFGVGRAYYGTQFGELPSDARAEYHMLWSTARQARSVRDEFAVAPLAMQQAGSLETLGNRPLMVVTALQDTMVGWMNLQNQLPKLSSNSSHWLLATTTHASLVYRQADAAFASQAIREVVTSVRTSKPLPKH
jgi:pimeloyl-ACP methyl ester carboxylesterase